MSPGRAAGSARRVVAGTGLLAALLALSLALGHALSRPGPPQDRPLAPLHASPAEGLRLTVLGTSLSHDEPWTAALARRLTTCLGQPVQVAVVARAGAAVDWGLDQVGAVAATAPDLVLVEFAINDADLRDGPGLGAARQMHDQLIAGLRAARPDAVLALMTMSPAQGLRGLVRPRLGAHYRQYRALAETHDIGLIDLYPRWRALPRAARGLARDGLHPDPAVASAVIVPVLARAIGGPRCG